MFKRAGMELRLNLRRNMTEEEEEELNEERELLGLLPESIRPYAVFAPEKVGNRHLCAFSCCVAPASLFIPSTLTHADSFEHQGHHFKFFRLQMITLKAILLG